MFNPRPRIDPFEIAPGHTGYVVDDALLEPGRWVAHALAHQSEFMEAPYNAFPGPELRLGDDFTAALGEFFAQHIRSRLGARRTLRMHSRLSIVTRRPEQLEPRQWICHRDRFGVPPDQCVAASVLYLFHDPRLGGTGFFRPRRPAAEIDRLVHDSGVLDGGEFSRRHGIAPGYLGASNDWFEKVSAIAPRWNRLIFYDGSQFHCSDIGAPELLDPDPARGRLTINGFYTCRRAAA